MKYRNVPGTVTDVLFEAVVLFVLVVLVLVVVLLVVVLVVVLVGDVELVSANALTIPPALIPVMSTPATRALEIFPFMLRFSSLIGYTKTSKEVSTTAGLPNIPEIHMVFFMQDDIRRLCESVDL